MQHLDEITSARFQRDRTGDLGCLIADIVTTTRPGRERNPPESLGPGPGADGKLHRLVATDREPVINCRFRTWRDSEQTCHTSGIQIGPIRVLTKFGDIVDDVRKPWKGGIRPKRIERSKVPPPPDLPGKGPRAGGKCAADLDPNVVDGRVACRLNLVAEDVDARARQGHRGLGRPWR